MVRNLATRFSIVADDEIEHLVEEFQDYQLSPDDDLAAVTNDSCVDKFWAEMGHKKTFVGAVRFPLLTRVMTTLSVIAHSHADSERVFSMVRKIDTDSRSQLGNDILVIGPPCDIGGNSPIEAKCVASVTNCGLGLETGMAPIVNRGWQLFTNSK